MLLSAKLQGQADNLRTLIQDEPAADTVQALKDALTVAGDVDTMLAYEASAAACYFAS